MIRVVVTQFLLLALTASVSCFANELKVGIVGSLAFTNAAGVPIAWAYNLQAFHVMYVLAIKHFNDRNPVFVQQFAELGSCNKTMVLAGDGIMLDDHGKTADGVQEVLQASLSPQGIHVVVGGLTSLVTVPLSVTSGALNLPMIGSRATSAALSDKAVHPMFARTVPSVVSTANAMAIAFDQWGFKHVGMIYGEDAFGSAWKDALFAALDKRGIRLTSTPIQSTLTGAALRESTDNAVRIISQTRLNVIVYMLLQVEYYPSLVVSAVQRNMTAANGKLWVISDQDQRFPPTLSNFTLVRSFLENALSFDATIRGFKNSVANPRWAQMGTYFRNSIAPSDINWAFPNYTIGGLSYRISSSAWFSSAFGVGSLEPAWAFTYDAIATLGLAACATGGANTIPSAAQLYQNMINTTFDGLSGPVSFTKTGDRDDKGIVFMISNYYFNTTSNSFVKITVGEYITQYDSWEISPSIMFPGNTSTPPLDVTPPFHDQNLLPIWAKAIGYAEVTIILFMAAMCAAFLIYNSKHMIVINSQPVFMKSLLFGIALAGSSIIPLTMDGPTVEDVGDAACMAFPWSVGIGLTIAVVSLMAKSYRVSLIFNNSKFRKITAPASRFFMVVLLMTAIEAALLIAWTITAPLKYVRVLEFINEFGQPVSSYGICLGPSPSSGAFVGCLCALHGVLIIVTMRVTQRLSKVPAKYQETRWVNIAALSTGQVYLIGLPSAAAVYESPIGRFFVLSTVTFLSCLTLLIAMFYPKYMMLHYGEDYFVSSDVASLHLEGTSQKHGYNNNTVDSSKNSKAVHDQQVATKSKLMSLGNVNSRVDVSSQTD